jgi:hypothetical protein
MATNFFGLFAGFALLVCLVGFFPSFVRPAARNALNLPSVIAVHGTLFFTWIVLLLAQTTLIATARTRAHRRLGYVGAALSLGMVVSGLAVGLHVLERDLAAGKPVEARTFFILPVLDMALFATLMTLAIVRRTQRDVHKRLIVLATIGLLGAPVFRMMLPVTHDAAIAGWATTAATDSLILVAMARDWLAEGRVHRVYLWGGLSMLLVHIAESTLGGTAPWQAFARWVVGHALG